MTDIQNWLESRGFGKYAAEFASQDISVELLADLSDADLRELGVSSLGDRKRLHKAIATPQSAPPTSVGAAARPAPIAPVPAAPTGQAVVEEAERRHATVMFSDLTGYTALNETFDPEEVEQVMLRIKHAANEIVERHGGRVNQFVGDEVMALFGVPVARRDDARRAVRAALELHRAVDVIAAGLANQLGRQLSMHSGLQTGLVIARRSDSRAGDYTITGDTVNTAARLRGLAQPGEVVVGLQAWQQVADYFEAEVGVAVEVKGKERPLLPYRIVAERSVPEGGSRPLVGRAEEVQQFDNLLQACIERKCGRVVFVRGDPGLGKSRLVAEFLTLARERGLSCHAASILDFGARTGHDAIRMLLQDLLGLAPDADEASRAQAIADLGADVRSGTDYRPFLYELLDAPPPPPVRAMLSAIDAAVRHKSTLEALSHVVQLQLARSPVLLLMEDIHWSDNWTLEQFGSLLALTGSQPLLVVMTTRFAGDPTVGEWRVMLHGLPMSSMDLRPLGAQEAIELAAGSASIPEDLMRICVERAEGNPLFLEQLLISAGDDGAGSLPGSIQALVQARMDRLAGEDKNALQAAALWGPSVSLEAIRHLVADPVYDPRTLMQQFLLRPEGEQLVFNHALIRDGAYGAMLHLRRRQLHQLAAQWVEPHDVLLAAEHWQRAQDPRAGQAYLRAGEERARQHHFAEALALVERGLKLADAGDSRFALQLAQARLLLSTGHPSQSIEASNAAIALASSGGERALGLIVLAAGLRIVDRAAEGLDLLDEAEPLAHTAGLTLDLSHLHELRGNLLFALGRTRECHQEHVRALELARAAGSLEAECAALGGMGDAQYALGKVRGGARLFGQCVAMAREQGFLKVELAYLPLIAWSSLYMLELPGALEASRQAIDQAARMTNRRVEMMARAQTVMIDGCVRGNLGEATQHLDRALELAQGLGSRRFEAMTWFFRALLNQRWGDRQVVPALLDMALTAGKDNLSFVGPQIYGLMGQVQTDALARHRALAEGERLLVGSAGTHNHFVMRDLAIQAGIDAGEWDLALHHCDQLENFTRDEPFPWADFIIARGRALILEGQGERGAGVRDALHSLRERALERQLHHYISDINAALERLSVAAT